ncbi:hypothetical protein ALC60_03792 [Trachymyrmex zeteki]|uniref:Uncharacterized protein n=1 Tax=Mycetomoellerius zeteki TaxID=64791 RepID=A0A151XAC2_9HYME|nr:hypothetical protein ALC60_03792 [Trachymyrmex zeteki]
MCEVSKSQRRTFRDQDPPRICNKSAENLLRDELEFSRSTPSSPTTLQRAASLEKCFSEPEFFQKQRELLSKHEQRSKEKDGDGEESVTPGSARVDDDSGSTAASIEDLSKEFSAKVPSPCKQASEVCANNLAKEESLGRQTNLLVTIFSSMFLSSFFSRSRLREKIVSQPH